MKKSFNHTSFFSRKHNTFDKKIINDFLLGKYQELEITISSFSITEKKAFFKRCGYTFLRHAIISLKTNDALKFILNHIPEIEIKDKLREFDFDILRNFLIGKHAHLQYLNEEEVKAEKILIKEKLEILYKIDPEGIKQFMDENLKENYTSLLKEYPFTFNETESLKSPQF